PDGIEQRRCVPVAVAGRVALEQGLVDDPHRVAGGHRRGQRPTPPRGAARAGGPGGPVGPNAPPTFVATPVVPSTHAIGVGQAPPCTTAVAAGRSIFWLLNAGPPVGKKPSSTTRRATFLAMSARPSSRLPPPRFDANRPARLL